MQTIRRMTAAVVVVYFLTGAEWLIGKAKKVYRNKRGQ